MTRRMLAAIAGFALAGGVAIIGCGVPIDREPRPISQTTVAPSATVPTTEAPLGSPEVSVYFLNQDQLQAQSRALDGEVTLGKALDLVLAAPAGDGSSELRTAVPPGTRIRGVQVEDGLATIDLTGEINDISGVAQKEAFAQIVFTALGFDEVQQIQFQIDGRSIDAPTDEGNLAVITADDYQPPLNPR